MRGVLPGLPSPVPLLHRLPGVLQEDMFLQRFLPAFDAGVAPVVATLDSLHAYVDPELAPEDFLDWLAGWVGVELDDAWSPEQRRSVVGAAALVHRQAGTADGVRAALALALDADVSLTESGGCSWSSDPGGEVPGRPDALVHVTVAVDDPDSVDVRRVEALLRSVKPAHVRHEFDVVRRSPSAGGDS
jgi:phage tail-like protein